MQATSDVLSYSKRHSTRNTLDGNLTWRDMTQLLEPFVSLCGHRNQLCRFRG